MDCHTRLGLRHLRRTSFKASGFSLIELMVVVLIVGILASMGMYGYGKWIGRARRAEAVGMLAEMSSKEMLYFGEFGAYLPLRVTPNDVTVNETPGEFYPISPNDPALESKRTSTSIANAGGWPVAWRSIGMRPHRTELYCTYLLNAGPPGVIPAGATYGVRILGAATIPIPWFYAIAACNFEGAPGLPDNVNVLGVSHNSPMIREWNEGR